MALESINFQNSLLANFIESCILEKNHQNLLQKSVLNHYWHELAGLLANHSQVEKVEGDTIYILCEHSMYNQEISGIKEQLINEIHKFTGFINLRKFKIKTGILKFNNKNEIKDIKQKEIWELEQKYQKFLDAQVNKKIANKLSIRQYNDEHVKKNTTKKILDPQYKKLYQALFGDEI